MTAPTTVTPLATYRNESPYPFCPGCGHGPILDGLNEALVGLRREPSRVVIVSDIGCSGLSDQYFETSAFHGLHGRSITYATGIKLARPDLTVIVVMGDGGTGIGGTHLISAARRNAGVTVLVFNNLNFGMTGGQHSTTTPTGAVTSTTPEGNLEQPLDICATVGVNGAGYVWRGTSFDEDLADRIAEAVAHPGFALLDIWELCTAYFVPRNRFSRRALEQTMADLEMSTGVLYRRDRAEYAAAYREAHAADPGQPPLAPRPLPAAHRSRLDRPFRLVVAGSAGEKVRSSTRLVGEAAIRSGLWAAQRDDYPVTVKTGHSVSELILGPEPIHYTGVAEPDALLVLSEDGLRKAGPYLERMTEAGVVFAFPAYGDVRTRAEVRVLDPTEARVGRTFLALLALAAAVKGLGLFPVAALREAAEERPQAKRIVTAIEAGTSLAEA